MPLTWVVVLGIVAMLAAAGAMAWRDAGVRAFIEEIEDLGWRGALRGVWGLVRDPRVPWFVRLLPVPLLIYLASPIDLIPDFIPVLGYLDDLILVPLGIALVIRLTPAEIVEAARKDHVHCIGLSILSGSHV